MGTARRLFIIVAEAALLFTLACWALALITMLSFVHISRHGETIAGVALLLPDGWAAWWVFQRFRAMRSRQDAVAAAIAFGVFAPIVLGIAHVLGELVGGYTEVLVGARFILPSVAAFVIACMTFIVPSGVVLWIKPRLATSQPVGGNDENVHC